MLGNSCRVYVLELALLVRVVMSVPWTCPAMLVDPRVLSVARCAAAASRAPGRPRGTRANVRASPAPETLDTEISKLSPSSCSSPVACVRRWRAKTLARLRNARVVAGGIRGMFLDATEDRLRGVYIVL